MISTTVLLALLLPASEPKIPTLIAHRGLLRHAPENTLAAFAACLELNLGFELDVRRSREGTLVIIHDEDLKRTTSGRGKVGELTLPQLRKLDAGKWFDPVFAGQKVPTLDEVLALVKARGKRTTVVAVDLKINDRKVESEVVQLARKHGVLEQIVCIGTAIDSPEVRGRLLAADRTTAAAVLAQVATDLPRALAQKDASWAYLRFVPTAEQVRQAHGAGKKVMLVGPAVMGKEPANWRKAREVGVDAILTDYPLECRLHWREQQK